MHTFSMFLTAFFTLRSFLNGNMVICPCSKHIVKCDLISDWLKRYCVGFSPYARAVTKVIGKTPHLDVHDCIIMFIKLNCNSGSSDARRQAFCVFRYVPAHEYRLSYTCMFG